MNKPDWENLYHDAERELAALRAWSVRAREVVTMARKAIPPDAYYPKNEGTPVAQLAQALDLLAEPVAATESAESQALRAQGPDKTVVAWFGPPEEAMALEKAVRGVFDCTGGMEILRNALQALDRARGAGR